MREKSWSGAEARFFRMDYEKVLERLRGYGEGPARGARAVILVVPSPEGTTQRSQTLTS